MFNKSHHGHSVTVVQRTEQTFPYDRISEGESCHPQLMDAKATTKSKMLRWVTQAGSPYLSEGTELIMSEFGKDYTNYMSILQLIASGMTTQSEIDGVIGKNTGAQRPVA